MRLGRFLIVSLFVLALCPPSARSANLVLNYGLEDPYTNAAPATNWWYYSDCTRETWAAMPPSKWGNGFWSGSNGRGGFGQDVPVMLHRGSVFVFAASARAEQNYTNLDTSMSMEFWSGASHRYTITNNVYDALALDRGN